MSDAAEPTGRAPRATFRADAKLQHKREFDAVYEAKARTERGPLILHTLPSSTGASRLGLAIGRRFGNAVRRNRMKRLLRESFRLSRHDFPAAYDVVIGCRGHQERSLDAYRALLVEAIAAAHLLWTKRQRRRPPAADAGTPETEAGPSASSPEG